MSRAYRPTRNRRDQDPMNYRIGPLGVATGVTTDGGDTSILNIEFNCPIDATLLNATSINFNATWMLGPFTQNGPRNIELDCGYIIAAGDLCVFELFTCPAFGPNTTGGTSSLYGLPA